MTSLVRTSTNALHNVTSESTEKLLAPPPVTSHVSLNEVTTRWRESAAGPATETLLMLHSLGLDASAFDGLRSALPDDWNVCAYDQRGHGVLASCPASALDALVADACAAIARATEEGGRIHLVGHSMGGAVAALAAARCAGRVASLTLIATPAGGGMAFKARGQAAITEGMPRVIETTLARWFGVDALSGRAERRVGNAIDYARAALQTMTAEGFAAAWHALSEFMGYDADTTPTGLPLATQLPSTLVIAGTDDLSTPPQVMQRIVDAFDKVEKRSGIDFKEIPEAGHMVVLTHATDIAAILRLHCLAASRSAFNEEWQK